MANTIDANLINKLVIGSANQILNKYVPMDIFDYRPSDQFISDKPKSVLLFSHSTAVAATDTNSSAGFCAGDTTLDDVAITLVRKTKSVRLDAQSLNSGLSMASAISLATEEFVRDLSKVYVDVFVAGANITDVELAAAADVPKGLPTAGLNSFIVLNKAGYKLIAPTTADGMTWTDGAFGFDRNVKAELGTAGLLGISGDKNQMIIATAMPIINGEKAGALAAAPEVLELANGMRVLSWIGYSPCEDAMFLHLDVYIGASLVHDVAGLGYKYIVATP